MCSSVSLTDNAPVSQRFSHSFQKEEKYSYHPHMPQISNKEQFAWTKAEAHYICACPNYLANNKYTRKEQVDEEKIEKLFPHEHCS